MKCKIIISVSESGWDLTTDDLTDTEVIAVFEILKGKLLGNFYKRCVSKPQKIGESQ